MDNEIAITIVFIIFGLSYRKTISGDNLINTPFPSLAEPKLEKFNLFFIYFIYFIYYLDYWGALIKSDIPLNNASDIEVSPPNPKGLNF